MTREELQTVLQAGLSAWQVRADFGRLLEVKVARRTAGGRAAELLITGESGQASVTGENIRWVFDGGRVGGSGALPSRLFVVERAGDGSRYTIRGGGYGHGVGICLSGAGYLAARGGSAAEILAHYYPGTSLTELSKTVEAGGAGDRPAPSQGGGP